MQYKPTFRIPHRCVFYIIDIRYFHSIRNFLCSYRSYSSYQEYFHFVFGTFGRRSSKFVNSFVITKWIFGAKCVESVREFFPSAREQRQKMQRSAKPVHNFQRC